MSNSSTPGPPQRGTGLSLYANLLDSSASAPGSISKGPVLRNSEQAQEEASAKKRQLDAGQTCVLFCYVSNSVLSCPYSCSTISAHEKTATSPETKTKSFISQTPLPRQCRQRLSRQIEPIGTLSELSTTSC